MIGNEKKGLSNLNWNLKHYILKYLDTSEQYLLFTMKEFYTTFKRSNILKLFDSMLSEFKSDLTKSYIQVDKVLSEIFIEKKISIS